MFDVGVKLVSTSSDIFPRNAGTVKSIINLPGKNFTYVGGSFNYAGNESVENVASYDWTKQIWSDIDGGINGQVNTMLIDSNYLYAGGSFSRAGAVLAKNVARYSLSSQKWFPMNDGIDAAIVKFKFLGSRLLAGGTFTGGSGTMSSLNYLALWDGNRWFYFSPGVYSQNNVCNPAGSCNPPAGSTFQDFAYIGNRIYLLLTAGPTSTVWMFDFNTWRQVVPTLTTISAISVDSTGNKPVFITNAGTGEGRVYDPNLDNDVSYQTGTPNNGGSAYVVSLAPELFKFNILLFVASLVYYFI